MMPVDDSRRPLAVRARRPPGRDMPPPLLLRATAVCLFVFPSSMVLAPAGAVGTVPLLLAAVLFIFWLASTIWGLHDAVSVRHPGRIGLTLLLLATCASYAAMFSGWTGGSSVVARAAADRWLVLLMASTGISMVAAETIRTIGDALVLVRAILTGAIFCSAVAFVQFYFRIDPVDWIRALMPGFTYNGGDTLPQARGTFLRVSGTTFTPIELAVVASMLLPLSIWRALFDTTGRKWWHWTGTLLLVLAIASTVSRSGTLGMVVVTVVFVPFLPQVARRWATLVIPAGVLAFFLLIPGFISTLGNALTAGNTDPSIATRTNNYPRIEMMVSHRPFLGQGPGNYMPTNALQILDNEYFNAAVTLGLLGMIAVFAYLVIPGLASLHAARMARDPCLRALAAAVASGGLVAAVGSFTFDSLSFPIFALLYPMFVGLGGAVWAMVRAEWERTSSSGQRKANAKLGLTASTTPRGGRL